MPEMDVKEDRTQYIILVNLPGADENDISVSVDGRRLTIKGKRKSQKQNRSSNGNIVFSERRTGNFRRSITLPEPVIESGMRTKVENGVLTIIIPKYKQPA
jgi:HSP20 family protein